MGPHHQEEQLTLLKDKCAEEDACMAHIMKEIEDWAPFPETAELNRLMVAYTKDKEIWEVKHLNFECLV